MTETHPGGGRRRTGSSPAFAAGDVISGRFTIVRLIGRGGMGEVYEAEDAQLRERVAVKTIRTDAIGFGPRALQRLRTEIQLARRVTHVNVCRLFDFELHETPAGEQVPFLSMELLEGETLSDHLLGRGRLLPAQALPLLEQIAAGLDAAHQVGIVHRDFKSANVMLVPQASGGLRAVVTDFGLARSTNPDGIVHDSEFSGTPAYMAPEQAEGRETTAASDVYAFGIVAYEMVTGALPFSGGDSPSSVANKRLVEPPLRPSACVPDLDPQWEKVILRCLERDPDRRFSTVGATIQALRPLPPAPEGPAQGPVPALPPERPDRQRGLRRLVAGLVIAATVALATQSWLVDPRTDHTPAATVRARRSVAVIGFKNLSGRARDAWLSTALSEMLATELAAGNTLRPIAGERVAGMKRDLALREADIYAPSTLAQIRRRLGVDMVVVGSYLASERVGHLRIDLHIQDTTTGETVVSIGETGNVDAVVLLVSRTGERMRRELNAAPLTAQQASAAAAAHPASSRAVQLYSEGLARLRAFDTTAARDRLMEAVHEDPRYAVAHSALSRTWNDLGYRENAEAAAKRALDLASSLSREEKLLTEARYAEATEDRARVAEIYKTLSDFAPDDIEYGLQLAEAMQALGRFADAETVLGRLHTLPAPIRDDPRLDLLRAQGLLDRDRGEADREALRLALRTRTEAEQSHLTFVAARAATLESRLRYRLGDAAGARAAHDYARGVYERAGDRRSLARLLLVQCTTAEPASAGTKMAEEALSIFQRIGDRIGESEARGALINLYSIEGRIKKAYDMAVTVRSTALAVGPTYAPAKILQRHRPELLMRCDLGDVLGARKGLDELFERTGVKPGAPKTLTYVRILREQGELSAAKAVIEPFLPLPGQRGGWPLSLLAYVLLLEGEIEKARETVERAIDSSPQTQRSNLFKNRSATLAVDLGRVLLEQDRHEEAEALLVPAKTRMRELGFVITELETLSLLIDLRLRQGRTREARMLAADAAEMASRSEHAPSRFSAQIAVARAQAASGDVRGATAALRRLVDTTGRGGFVTRQFEARLALAEVSRGRSRDSIARLQQLRSEAQARGQGLIAIKAARLLERAPAQQNSF